MGDIVGVDKILADQLEAKGFGGPPLLGNWEPPAPTCQECDEEIEDFDPDSPQMCARCLEEFDCD